jgi:hypothetical protein
MRHAGDLLSHDNESVMQKDAERKDQEKGKVE